MRRREYSPYETAQRYVGVKELPGQLSNPLILAMLRLDTSWPEGDHVPWCSAFVNWIAWQWRLPRSKDLRARSWLHVGEPFDLAQAEPGFDVVILTRGGADQPGPDVMDAPGHVGFFAGRLSMDVLLLGGNQGDRVSIERFPAIRVLGVRRLA